MSKIIIVEHIERKIYFIRGTKVMLSHDLAELYQVKTKVLLQAVKRNKERFPDDFMFQLTWDELEILKPQNPTAGYSRRVLRSQIVTLKQGRNIKYLPYAFTEQGVAMLSSVLRSKRAIAVNIVIMRTFAKLREVLLAHKELNKKLADLERKVGRHDEEILAILEAIRQLMAPPSEKPKAPIGFHAR